MFDRSFSDQETLRARSVQSASEVHSTLAVRPFLALLLPLALVTFSWAGGSSFTSRGNNARTNTNENETVLTPANVNVNSFGRLFNYSIDYQALAQPLYVPNVDIPGKGTHNVVYVVTQKDSVYAFDADSNAGDNAAPLWSVNFTDPANGITTASGANLPCTNPNSNGPGFNEEGIRSTPVIDPATGTMYLVAKTAENGTVHFRLHALDIGSGQEKLGGPVDIQAQSVSNRGTVWNLIPKIHGQRPGLLLLNGAVYIGFGSIYCNGKNSGWVLGYDATTLEQIGVYNTNPDHGRTSIWQTGQGLAADDAGNIYVETAEGTFDVDVGGQGYTNSVVKLSTNPLAFADFFTPWNVALLNQKDLDLSSSGAVVLPDQDGPHPHEMVATGKQGTIYLLDRDNLGGFNPTSDQIVQELPLAVGEMFASPVYWNGMVYIYGKNQPLHVYSIADGLLSPFPIGLTPQSLGGSHTPAISANGNTNGVLWVIAGSQMWSFDAVTLQLLYTSNQLKARDQLPLLAHFATPTIANGRLYLATRTTLEVYGLIPQLNITSGNSQSATVLTDLPAPLQVQATDSYTGQPLPGVTVTFSDGGKGGVFDNPFAITDDNGFAATNYTLPKVSGTYALTATSPNLGTATFSEMALPGPVIKIVAYKGNKQIGPAGTVLPTPLKVKAQDIYQNGVPGISVAFDDGTNGGNLTPVTTVTDASGFATTTYQLPPTPGTYYIFANSPGLRKIKFAETAQ